MSSILKALRKVGEEKRSDRHAAPDLRLDQGLAPVKSRPFLPLLLGIALGAVIIGPIFLLAFKDSEPVAKVQPKTTAQPITKDQPLAKSEEAVDAEKKAVNSTAIVDVSPINSAIDQSRKDVVKPVKVPVVILSPDPVTTLEPVIIPESATTPVQEKIVKSVQATNVPVKKQTVTEAPVIIEKTPEIMQKPPELAVVNTLQAESSELPDGISLVVTEIFYNEDSTNSMAVINELPVMVGTYIDSAVVAAIQADSVLFVINGKSYVVAPSIP